MDVTNCCVMVSLSLFGSAVFRQGDLGTNWYVVLSGALELSVSETGESKVRPGTVTILLLLRHLHTGSFHYNSTESVEHWSHVWEITCLNPWSSQTNYL